MSSANPRVWRNLWHFLAFGFGSGLAPKAQGTWGTVVGLLFVPVLSQLSLTWLAIFLLAATLFGCWLCDKVAKDLGVHDHNGIVWDEFVGIWLTFFAVPLTWYWLVLGFVLFRVFDIAKPWPVSWADQKVGGGVGIMLDDILAGIMAAGVLQLVLFIVAA
ncbi:phosphatidylglycerophosphatase [Thiopseudomonas alkaliphila]|uniref:Phosphatidylglycerophosphatase A n=1 Tax=Thiopseudomonas alkaliphila TaxID=1697053 RepID=A0A0K1XF67_9GAMM|nr:phosphatidylglycerophosphatase A [Thiopseudomonas alkaliphila]AKX59894.1 phosphatidylglycerophosphatase [Thiopseudomonas alkaliphila]